MGMADRYRRTPLGQHNGGSRSLCYFLAAWPFYFCFIFEKKNGRRGREWQKIQ